MDIILFPIAILSIYLVGHCIRNADARTEDAHMTLNAWQLVFSLLLFVLLAPLCFWLAIEGFQNPLELFTGVKGNAHGYTLAYLGVIVGIISIFLSYISARNLFRLMKFDRSTK